MSLGDAQQHTTPPARYKTLERGPRRDRGSQPDTLEFAFEMSQSGSAADQHFNSVGA
jgi:hypothetical protein